MYCIILNYNTAQTDVLELPENDFWDESKIEEYTGYNMTDSYFMLTDEKPHLNFINY
jgi:hypothetical protein